MKRKNSFWQIMLMSIVAVVCVCVSACSSDDPEPIPPTPVPEENGEVVFGINLPEGIGGGTTENPAVVQKGETLDMTISQKSSYTDPNGTVFTCEPKAEIKLSAKLDTVVAKDIASLTKVKDGSDVKSNSDGTAPVRHKTVQTFEIGGQNIVFDLSHEVYTYVNSLRKEIEMPYVKVNQAKLGNTQAKEEAPQGRAAAVALTGVTVRPLAVSRATTVTDSTMYEVNAMFNLDIESVNAKTDTKKTLVFSVTYIGVVETVTELKDPEASVSYVWDIKSGTNSTTSPFIKTAGKPMEIWMCQSSRYSDEYGNEAVGEPKAKIKLSLAQDTIWANSLDELKEIVNKSGEVGKTQAAKQVFGAGNQDITIDWSYETATAELAGKQVQMPHYALSGATFEDVSVQKLDSKLYQGKEADLYEVTVKFHQTATQAGMLVGAEHASEVIEYVVSFVGAIEIKLVNVEYIPGGEWVDPHDNMHLGYFAKVIRKRTYSNGVTQEDEFYDFGHPIQWMTNEPDPVKGEYGDKSLTIYEGTDEVIGDSIRNYSTSIEFSTKAGGWPTEFLYERYTADGTFTDYNWAAYSESKLYNESTNITQDISTSYPQDSRKTGWYFKLFSYSISYDLKWKLRETSCISFTTLDSVFDFYDQFLVIDGKRIDFTSLHNLQINHTMDKEDFSDSDREGVNMRLKTNVSYLGKNFQQTSTFTLYVAK